MGFFSGMILYGLISPPCVHADEFGPFLFQCQIGLAMRAILAFGIYDGLMALGALMELAISRTR